MNPEKYILNKLAHTPPEVLAHFLCRACHEKNPEAMQFMERLTGLTPENYSMSAFATAIYRLQLEQFGYCFEIRQSRMNEENFNS